MAARRPNPLASRRATGRTFTPVKRAGQAKAGKTARGKWTPKGKPLNRIGG